MTAQETLKEYWGYDSFRPKQEEIVEAALEEMGLTADEVLLIGDKYETDILAGINAGVDTLLVLTGVTRAEDVANLPASPTYILDNLSEWVF